MIRSRVVERWQAEAKAESVREAKFDALPPDLLAKLAEPRSLDVWKKWTRLAAKANSLEDFRKDVGA